MSSIGENLELFADWYLRFNGYFTVNNFLVHAPEDPVRIYRDSVGAHTEADLIGVALPYSDELAFPKAPELSLPEGWTDVLILEAKSGIGKDSTKPNKIWRQAPKDPQRQIEAVAYMIRFVGFHRPEQAKEIATTLAQNYRYEDAERRCVYRYAMLCSHVARTYLDHGVLHIPIDAAIEFVVHQRGQSWLNAHRTATRSSHDKWPPLINGALERANQGDLAAAKQYLRDQITQPPADTGNG